MFCNVCREVTGAGSFCPRCGSPASVEAKSPSGVPVVPAWVSTPSPQPKIVHRASSSVEVPTYLKVTTWILGIAGAFSVVVMWTSGYTFSVLAMMTACIMLIVGMVSGNESWCFPTSLILVADSFGSIVAPIDPAQTTLLGNLISTGAFGFLTVKWWQVTKG
ncbi:MAG: hypothetical protein WCJ89_03740 [Actinomycetes bacterium]